MGTFPANVVTLKIGDVPTGFTASSRQEITTVAAHNSDSNIDLGVDDLNIRDGATAYLYIRVHDAFESGGAATLAVKIQDSPDETDWADLSTESPVAVASLTEGYVLMNTQLPTEHDIYLRAVLTIGTAAMTAGSVDAYVLLIQDVAEICRVTGGGIENALKDASNLASVTNKHEYGRLDGGTVHVEGWYDPADDEGQGVLISSAVNQTKLHAVQLWYGTGSTDYLELSETLADALVTNANLFSVDKDASGLLPIAFDLKISYGYFIQAS